jgi:hypothetical protein
MRGHPLLDALISVVLLCAGGAVLYFDVQIDRDRRTASAVVVDVSRSKDRTDARIRFRADGKEIITSIGTDGRDMSVGDRVDVDYSSTSPTNARVSGNRREYWEGLIMTVVGGVWLAATIVGYRAVRGRRRAGGHGRGSHRERLEPAGRRRHT